MLNDREFQNFDHAEIDQISDYGGSDRKTGVIVDGERYMLKYSTKRATVNDLDTSYVNNTISEYVGSHIISTFGLPVHQTFLGSRDGALVVACKNFLSGHQTAHEFAYYQRRVYDSSEIGRIPSLDQIYHTLDQTLITIRSEAIERYWDTFIADTLVGNFDRHKGNWSYVVDLDTGRIGLAPIYDCGSTLFPALSEEGMQKVLSDREETMKRVLLFPKAALLVNQKKVSYRDMLFSGYDQHCTQAVLRMIPMVDLDQIDQVIDQTPAISYTRKLFYRTMVHLRYENILVPALQLAQNHQMDLDAYERISRGKDYTEEDFLQEYDHPEKRRTALL